ncbi:hypothetical protein Pelo_10403 [Pelomyxa schiedti]|nr:hypothetical protein Pelo_10403 [Pelomyxa schiedti]
MSNVYGSPSSKAVKPERANKSSLKKEALEPLSPFDVASYPDIKPDIKPAILLSTAATTATTATTTTSSSSASTSVSTSTTSALGSSATSTSSVVAANKALFAFGDDDDEDDDILNNKVDLPSSAAYGSSTLSAVSGGVEDGDESDEQESPDRRRPSTSTVVSPSKRRRSHVGSSTPRPPTAYKLFCNEWKKEFSAELARYKKDKQALDDSGFTGNLTLAALSRWKWETMKTDSDLGIQFKDQYGGEEKYLLKFQGEKQRYESSVDRELKIACMSLEEESKKRKGLRKALEEEAEKIIATNEESYDNKTPAEVLSSLKILLKHEKEKLRKKKKYDEMANMIELLSARYKAQVDFADTSAYNTLDIDGETIVIKGVQLIPSHGRPTVAPELPPLPALPFPLPPPFSLPGKRNTIRAKHIQHIDPAVAADARKALRQAIKKQMVPQKTGKLASIGLRHSMSLDTFKALAFWVPLKMRSQQITTKVDTKEFFLGFPPVRKTPDGQTLALHPFITLTYSLKTKALTLSTSYGFSS